MLTINPVMSILSAPNALLMQSPVRSGGCEKRGRRSFNGALLKRKERFRTSGEKLFARGVINSLAGNCSACYDRRVSGRQGKRLPELTEDYPN